MKKLLSFCLYFFLTFSFFAGTNIFNSNNYAEYTLENGMQVFVLEDFSTATIRVEYSVHAGISAQNAANTGFFPLYTRLFKTGGEKPNLLKNMTSECNADSSRYIINVSPSSLEETLAELSQHAFSPIFSNRSISDEYSKLKTEVMQYAMTPAAFINTSIDSRIYSSAPWKQDSGIYPQIFSKSTPSQTRSILSRIGKTWYTPQNSALFINGAIKKEAVLLLAEKTFGKYKAAAVSGQPEAITADGTSRKFVMHDKDFSPELTQIVIEYTSLDMNQSNLAAATYNNDISGLKRTLCENHLFNIRGPEYINVSAVHKNGSSRLIFQSLLEMNRRSALEQAEGFIATIGKSAEITDRTEYDSAKQYLSESFNQVTSSSTSFMDFLSQLWSIDAVTRKNDFETEELLLAQKLMDRPKKTFALDVTRIEETLSSEVPFVFVLVNTKTFSTYKEDFKRLGYEEISSKNGSWYTQKLFENARKETASSGDDTDRQKTDLQDSISNYLNEASSSAKKFRLSNGIPVTVKTNRVTSNTIIMLCIDGGKLADGSKPGFESVMANALSSNIRKEIDKYKIQGMLTGFPVIQAETTNFNSTISVECAKEDISLIIRSISDALIFGDITPAQADGCVYYAQTQKRLFNASPVNQMNFRAMKYFFDSTEVRNVYDSEKDILAKTKYTDIMASYPRLLDSKLYSIIIAGNTDSEAVHYVLEETLGILKPQPSSKGNRKTTVPEPDFPQKPRRISLKIRHLFYTDVKAEDAGPMPAILVPTKNFEDPVQFWFKPPVPSEKDSVLFDALLFRLKEKVQEHDTDARIFVPTNDFHCGSISFLNVEHTGVIDELYVQLLNEMVQDLSEEADFTELSAIKNAWILNRLSETETNAGTARLLNHQNAASRTYIEDYEYLLKADKAQIKKILQECFPQDPLLKIYSADSKK